MSLEENKALVRPLMKDVFTKGDLTILDGLVAPDFVLHGTTGQELRGREAYKQYIITIRKAFPDFHVTIEDMIAEGDKVVCRTTLSGTFKGEFRGILPNNKKVTVWAIRIDRIVNSKIAETWTRTDTLSQMQQFGAIPPRGKKQSPS
jgi:steroid delta-isomerase-like uncharacterized protein